MEDFSLNETFLVQAKKNCHFCYIYNLVIHYKDFKIC